MSWLRRAASGAAAAAVLLIALGGRSRAEGVPDWLRETCTRSTPAWVGRAATVMLDDEEFITIPNGGRYRTEVRGAIRVLRASGSEEAHCSATWLRGGSDVKDFRAWLVRPGGVVEAFDRGDATEYSLAGQFTLYSDARALRFAPQSVPVGTVFAWDIVTDEDPFLNDWRWYFRGSSPSLYSRVTMSLPANCEPVVTRFGADSVVSRHDERNWSWEMSNQPAIPDEPLRSATWSIGPCLALSYRATDDHERKGRSFSGWQDVSGWLDELSAPQSEVTPQLTARANALTAGQADSLERLRALARDVQRLNYVSIELGITRGWGYRPNEASSVFQLGYGDCKDKANLLRALVKASGGQAWLMGAYLGGRDRVEERWPSPDQFNHCILAIRVPHGTHLPATFEHPALGTLLAFDPTDPWTPFGELPEQEQGSLCLLESAKAGGLVRMPVAPDGRDRTARHIEATLDADGGLQAQLIERRTGALAARLRMRHQSESNREYQKALEAVLTGQGGAATVTSVTFQDDSLSGACTLRASFATPRFARLSGYKLMTFSTSLAGKEDAETPDSTRTLPIALERECIAETVLVHLPEGFDVDELPDPIHDHQDFGALDVSWAAEPGVIRYVRSYRVEPMTLPAGRAREVRELLAANLAAQRAPVVLLRR